MPNVDPLEPLDPLDDPEEDVPDVVVLGARVVCPGHTTAVGRIGVLGVDSGVTG